MLTLTHIMSSLLLAYISLSSSLTGLTPFYCSDLYFRAHLLAMLLFVAAKTLFGFETLLGFSSSPATLFLLPSLLQ